jgi:hypothetical protein
MASKSKGVVEGLLFTNLDDKDGPLTPALSPSEGERGNRCPVLERALALTVPGRASEAVGERKWTARATAGIRKASEPGTHMMTPAAAWSVKAVVPNSRGASA